MKRTLIAFLTAASAASLSLSANAAPSVTKVGAIDSCEWTPTYVGEKGSLLYFLQGSALWTSDGSSAGTKRVVDALLPHPTISAWSFRPESGRVAPNGVVLLADLIDGGGYVGEEPDHLVWFVDTSTSSIDRSSSIRAKSVFSLGSKTFLLGLSGFYETDGTTAGTKLVASFGLNPDGGISGAHVDVIANSGSTAIIAVYTAVKKVDYFSTDGTASGTHRLTTASIATSLRYDYGFLPGIQIGNSLYIPDTASKKKISRIDLALPAWSEVEIYDTGATIDAFVRVGSSFVVRAYPNAYVTDGTAAGTAAFAHHPLAMTQVGTKLFFSEQGALTGGKYTYDLYTSDLTAAGTTKVAAGKITVTDAGASSYASSVYAVDGRAYATFDDGVHGAELWTSDGTAAGTALLTDLSPGPASSKYSALWPWSAGGAYFVANTSQTECGLYRLADPKQLAPADGGIPADGNVPSDGSVPLDGSAPKPADASIVSSPSASNDASPNPPEEPTSTGCTATPGADASGLAVLVTMVSLVVAVRRRSRQRT